MSAPVFSEVGYLAEVFRRAPGTLVSDNPSGRLGANTDTTTVLHYAESRADVPNRRRVRRHYRCKSAGGSAIRAVECLDDEEGIVHVDGEDYFARILRDYLALGRGRRGQVGDAAAELIEAADIANFGAQWMTRNLSQP